MLHKSGDQYSNKVTYVRNHRGKQVVCQVISSDSEFCKTHIKPIYDTFNKYHNVFSELVVLPFSTRFVNNKLFLFLEYLPTEVLRSGQCASIQEVFKLLKTINTALSNTDLELEYFVVPHNHSIFEQYCKGVFTLQDIDQYYDRANLTLVRNDCEITNLCVINGKLKLLDLDSIMTTEARHQFDAFLFDWFFLDPYIHKELKYEVSHTTEMIQFIEDNVLPELTEYYNNPAEYYKELLIHAYYRLALMKDEKFFEEVVTKNSTMVEYRTLTAIRQLQQQVLNYPVSG